MPLIPQIELTETTKRRVFFSTVAAAWLGLLTSVAVGAALLLQRPTKPVDVIAEINSYVDASLWARDYLLVWLAGDTTQSVKLASMTALEGKPDLNKDPMTVLDIRNEPGVLRTPTDGPEIEWAMTLSAVLVPPGANGASVRTYYRVTFLNAGATYKALLYPRPTNATTQPVQIQSHYTVGLDDTGPLGATIRDFMTAFYTAPEGTGPTDNKANPLGRFVSPEFSDEPLAGSPYTTLDITGIAASADTTDPATAQPGDTLHILVSAKASISNTTFNLLSAPLRVTLSPNQQWLVDGFDEPIRFGTVNYQ